MIYTVECELEKFPAWGDDAIHTLDVLIENGDVERVEDYIEELWGARGELPSETEINDLLRFEFDKIANYLGFESWEEYEG